MKKERKEKKKDKKLKKGGKKEEKERKGKGKEKRRKKERGRGIGVYGVRGAWVLRRVGPHTNNARSTWMFSVFHHLQKSQQRKQHHSRCEAK